MRLQASCVYFLSESSSPVANRARALALNSSTSSILEAARLLSLHRESCISQASSVSDQASCPSPEKE